MTDALVFTTNVGRYFSNAPHMPVLAVGASDLYYAGDPVSYPSGSGGDAPATGLYRSTDAGATWTPVPFPLLASAATSSDTATYYTHKPAVIGAFFISTTLHVYVYDGEHPGVSGAKLWHATYDGASWGSVADVTPSTAYGLYTPSSMAQDASGAIWLVAEFATFVTGNVDTSALYACVTTDGTTWTHTVAIESLTGLGSPTFNSDFYLCSVASNLPHAAVFFALADNSLWFSTTADSGATWSAPAAVTLANVPITIGALYAGSTIHLIAAQTNFGSFTSTLYHQRSTDNGGTWSGWTAIDGPVSGTGNGYAGLAYDLTTTTLFVYHSTDNTNTIYQLHSTDDGATWSVEVVAIPDPVSGSASIPVPAPLVPPSGLVRVPFVADDTGSGFSAWNGYYHDEIPHAPVVLPAPVVVSVTPNAGSLSADTPVLITGYNLTGATGVSLAGVAAGSVSPGDIADDGTSIAVTLLTDGFAGGQGCFALSVANPDAASTTYNPVFTVYDATGPDPTPDAVADALAGRLGPVALRFRFELRDRQNVFLADITHAVREDTGCVIHLDNDQAVPRTAEFVFDGANLPEGFDAGESTRHCVAVFADLDVAGTTYSWQQGLFHLDQPELDQYPGGSVEWKAKGADLAIVLSDRSLRAPFSVAAGADYLTTIAGLLTGAGLSHELPHTIPQALPAAVPWSANTPLLTVVNDLLLGLNWYPIWPREDGVCTSRVRVNPAFEPAAVHYDTTAEPRMPVATPSTRGFSVSQLYNWINVAIDDPARTPYVASQSNNDASAPASIPSSGKVNFKALSGSASPSTKALLSAQIADAISAFELRAENTKAVTRTLETQPDPRRTNREWYLLHLEGYEVDTLWRVKGWDLTCTAGGPMVHHLEFAQAISVNGPPPIATIVQHLGDLGIADSEGAVAGQGAILRAEIPIEAETTAGDTIIAAVLCDVTDPSLWSAVDSAGNVYEVTNLNDTTFGTLEEGGQFTVMLLACQNAAPLLPGDVLTITFGQGAFQVAASVWEVGGLQAQFFDTDLGAWAKAVQSSGDGSDSLFNPDSGFTPVIANAYDLIIGVAGAMWDATAFDGGPAPPYLFTPDLAEGWETAPSATVRTQPVNALYALLWIGLQIGPSAGAQYRLSGALSDPAAGWGASCVPLAGNQVV